MTLPDGERANVLTHGIGLVAAIAGATVLVVRAALGGDPWKVVGVSVFGASLVALYAASTGFHAAREAAVRARLRVLDHAAIYLLIAGTYTPFMLDEVRGPWGWSLFGVVWGLAVVGVGFKIVFTGRFRRASTAIYVAMGWLVLVGAGPVVRALPTATLVWLVAGGVAYTAGVPFYLGRMRHGHAIWHGFVVAGSVCHGVAVGTLLA